MTSPVSIRVATEKPRRGSGDIARHQTPAAVLDDVAPVGDLDAAARSQRFICNRAPPKNPSTLSKSMISGTPLRSLSRFRSPSGACS